MSDSKPEVTVKTGAVDTHCHLFLLDREPADVVEAARAAGVDTLICVGIDPETSRRSLELAESFAGIFATAGMHPHEAAGFDREAAGRIEELLGDPLVIAVGECGLDFFRMHSPREDQERCLRAHIALSNESGKPMVVHVREAWPDVLRVLDEGSAERVVIHCFSGDAEIARECAARGYWMSFAGNVTYPKNDHLRQAAAAVDIDRLLTETDSPFLSPQKLRGHDNEPANVIATLEALALARNATTDDVRDTTSGNARRAFPGLQQRRA
ncbi:MAG: TatD family hydrolase [Actinomycetota bacterium]|nr:TatD family hydrolase [Actinomycetota bacterium]